MVQDITERKAIEESLLLQALHDPLTGLPHRIRLRDRVAQALNQRPDGTHTALFVLDLDGSKDVNDRFGHPAGDGVLRDVASRWRALLRRGETLARLGGDEFALLARRVPSPEAATHIGVRLVRQLETPFVVGGGSVLVGVSIGIAFYPDHGQALDSRGTARVGRHRNLTVVADVGECSSTSTALLVNKAQDLGTTQ